MSRSTGIFLGGIAVLLALFWRQIAAMLMPAAVSSVDQGGPSPGAPPAAPPAAPPTAPSADVYTAPPLSLTRYARPIIMQSPLTVAAPKKITITGPANPFAATLSRLIGSDGGGSAPANVPESPNFPPTVANPAGPGATLGRKHSNGSLF